MNDSPVRTGIRAFPFLKCSLGLSRNNRLASQRMQFLNMKVVMRGLIPLKLLSYSLLTLSRGM